MSRKNNFDDNQEPDERFLKEYGGIRTRRRHQPDFAPSSLNDQRHAANDGGLWSLQRDSANIYNPGSRSATATEEYHSYLQNHLPEQYFPYGNRDESHMEHMNHSQSISSDTTMASYYVRGGESVQRVRPWDDLRQFGSYYQHSQPRNPNHSRIEMPNYYGRQHAHHDTYHQHEPRRGLRCENPDAPWEEPIYLPPDHPSERQHETFELQDDQARLEAYFQTPYGMLHKALLAQEEDKSLDPEAAQPTAESSLGHAKDAAPWHPNAKCDDSGHLP